MLDKNSRGDQVSVNVLHLVGGDFDFILQHPRRPQHANDIGLLSLPEANGQVRRILSQIAGRSVDFKLLPNAIGKNFDLRADGALVIVQPLERQPQRVVLVAAFVAEQYGRPVILRDQKIDRAVVVVIAGDNGARLFELNLVESGFGGDIFESVRAEIAEEADFALAVFCLADGNEIDPAVVVVVDGGDAVGTDPVRFGEWHLVERFALVVVPKGEAGCSIRV